MLVCILSLVSFTLSFQLIRILSSEKKYHVAYIFCVFGTAYVFDEGFQCGKNNNSLATEEASIKSLHVQFFLPTWNFSLWLNIKFVAFLAKYNGTVEVILIRWLKNTTEMHIKTKIIRKNVSTFGERTLRSLVFLKTFFFLSSVSSFIWTILNVIIYVLWMKINGRIDKFEIKVIYKGIIAINSLL